MSTTTQQAVVLTPEELLTHWQGHRSLTRKVIEAFPEKELFNFSIGGMRTFAAMTKELLAIAAPGLREIVARKPSELDEKAADLNTKEALLKKWDDATVELNELWPKLSVNRFHETVLAFGKYEGTVISSLVYYIDNEIHHRGQGYVYLRALGIEPPSFWGRPF